ncbi:nucleic-acid-binding protein from transposon X-element [Caerostris extrusa]|uniref:Nucleic-acid-binding protein from transposon X-element n=1 Tax=Caerostris extrusa TaxID=172846 RepID=A0AAV4XQ31_CAEEX|nr:nucleic-acid-binding protein from transposon X-element [Caerostris extrusa]
MPLFLAVLPKSDHSKNLFNLEFLNHFKIKCEPLRKKPGPAQCFNCQQFFHHSRFCSRNPVCVKCAGPHKSGNCPKPKDSPACCALCKGDHTANYSGCPRNPVNFVPAPPPKFNVWEERLKHPKLRINLQHPTSANNIPPSTSVTEIPKLITSPSENNQSTSNAPLSNNKIS